MNTLHKITLCVALMFAISSLASATDSAPAADKPSGKIVSFDLGSNKTLTVGIDDKSLPQLTAPGCCKRAAKEIAQAMTLAENIGKGTGYEFDAYGELVAKVKDSAMPSGQDFTWDKNSGHILLKKMAETQAVFAQVVQPQTMKDGKESELVTECIKKHESARLYLYEQLGEEENEKAIADKAEKATDSDKSSYSFKHERTINSLLAHASRRDVESVVQQQAIKNAKFESVDKSLASQIDANKAAAEAADRGLEAMITLNVSRINNLARETITLPDETVFVFDTETGIVSILLDGTTYPTDLKVDWQKVDDVMFNQENIRWLVNVRLLPEKPGKQYEIFVTNANWQEICTLRETKKFGTVRLNGKITEELAPSKEETILGKPKALPVVAAATATATATATSASASASASAQATSASASAAVTAAYDDGEDGDVLVYSAHRKGLWGREVTESKIVRHR